jgi:uncharacterized RDD family membrane protein YckC
MGQVWYYSRGENQEGPVPIEQLQEMLRNGAIQPDNLVWTEGLTQWTAAQMIPALMGTATAAPVPPSAVAPAMPIGILGYQNPTFGHSDYAGFWMRFCAAFIDGLVMFVPTFIAGFVIGFIAGASGIRQNTPAWTPVALLIQVVGQSMSWLYCAGMESSVYQATLGKLAVGIKVTDLDGGRIGFGRATGRHFGKWISGIILLIGYMMAGWTEKKQALHDMMAGTLVVRK